MTLLQISSDWMPSETSETYVQFYGDEMHFLAVHETQLAVYEATKLERVKQVCMSVMSLSLLSHTYIMILTALGMISVDHWRFLHKDFACGIVM